MSVILYQEEIAWKIYKERYLNRKTSFTDIEKFLIDDYGIELLHISIETPVEPYHRWKAELRRKTKGLSNIVYRGPERLRGICIDKK